MYSLVVPPNAEVRVVLPFPKGAVITESGITIVEDGELKTSDSWISICKREKEL